MTDLCIYHLLHWADLNIHSQSLFPRDGSLKEIKLELGFINNKYPSNQVTFYNNMKNTYQYQYVAILETWNLKQKPTL